MTLSKNHLGKKGEEAKAQESVFFKPSQVIMVTTTQWTTHFISYILKHYQSLDKICILGHNSQIRKHTQNNKFTVKTHL